MQRAYDTETIISTRHKAERDTVKVEMAVLLDENRFLRGSVKILESQMDSSFMDGHFTTSYEEATIPDPSSKPPVSDGSIKVETQDPSSAPADLGRSSAQHIEEAGSPVAASLLEEKQSRGEQIEGSQPKMHAGEGGDI
ncbi:hypothetical protein LWI29_028328 [Acer saccharum]|uniref:Uncharacterized protein n=1 Tax=Acer saccharum TaxID=4024 RepID=A0AA39THP3_ACESA|nr:hypothetical protein LWI29_028328 [Acer saccharum]